MAKEELTVRAVAKLAEKNTFVKSGKPSKTGVVK